MAQIASGKQQGEEIGTLVRLYGYECSLEAKYRVEIQKALQALGKDSENKDIDDFMNIQRDRMIRRINPREYTLFEYQMLYDIEEMSEYIEYQNAMKSWQAAMLDRFEFEKSHKNLLSTQII